MKHNLKAAILATAAAVSVPATASAAVLVEIERLSDVEAVITASGIFDFGGFSNVELTGAAGPGDEGTDPFTGSLSAGASPLDSVYVRLGGTFNYILDFDSDILSGSSFSGSINVELDASETWGAVGSSGIVGFEETDIQLGRWVITDGTGPAPVPLPAGGVLLLSAIGAAAALRRKAG